MFDDYEVSLGATNAAARSMSKVTEVSDRELFFSYSLENGLLIRKKYDISLEVYVNIHKILKVPAHRKPPAITVNSFNTINDWLSAKSTPAPATQLVPEKDMRKTQTDAREKALKEWTLRYMVKDSPKPTIIKPLVIDPAKLSVDPPEIRLSDALPIEIDPEVIDPVILSVDPPIFDFLNACQGVDGLEIYNDTVYSEIEGDAHYLDDIDTCDHSHVDNGFQQLVPVNNSSSIRINELATHRVDALNAVDSAIQDFDDIATHRIFIPNAVEIADINPDFSKIVSLVRDAHKVYTSNVAESFRKEKICVTRLFDPRDLLVPRDKYNVGDFSAHIYADNLLVCNHYMDKMRN